MNLNKLKPRETLNKAFLKAKPNRSDIESFKINFIKLLNQINEAESEEFHKNIISDFLKNTYYKDNHFINTKGRNDLVIHNGKDAKSSVGVIVEAKKPTNKSEMVLSDNINTKAFHELILYYLRERITLKNLELKYLIVTNIYEWFIFDAQLFERLFANNKQFVSKFKDFEEKRLSDTRTDFFYKEIAEPFVDAINTDITFTHLDIRDFEKILRNSDKQDDNKLIVFYKLFSPEHLLKLPFANDSNSLDKSFYTELLHIIGLTEAKEGSKKIIGRKVDGERNQGALIENAINQLESLDKISRLEKPQLYGSTKKEKLFNIALELSITWINRILFLKLLEAQLIKYNNGDKSFAFLNLEKVKNYDDLNSLFFSVLARKPEERNVETKKLFAQVPYLNSSLFEPTEIEHTCLFISQLNNRKLPVLNTTVLKDKTGKKINGEIDSLEYLFKFLDAYDFASEGSEEIQEENKTLINASVLGLIFEKINGYKDGSFFTPGFITMYMCRETIRRAVVQKFNDVKGWNCQDIKEIYNRIEDIKEANIIINSLKICDPAVGSGHFLVSALNEIIAIKNDLNILLDKEGRRLKEYTVEVINDELIVTDEEEEIFEYNPKNKESQRIQEALFNEKQTIIENCLFGVDINPNSVKICRLRLWIELLKNAYYKAPTFTELETLPNIDINIKCGNSLISRYPLDADLKKALRKSKWSINSYRLAVMAYRNAENKEQKQSMGKLIDQIKNNFESEITSNDRRVIRLKNLRDELKTHAQQTNIFEFTKNQKTEWEKKLKKLTAEINKRETELEEIKSNKIYENAFEWRFEFPEVLSDDGDFIGFDVVIGNPPYIDSETMVNIGLEDLRKYLANNLTCTKGNWDIYVAFFEVGFNLLKPFGIITFISPDKWISKPFGYELRKKYLQNYFIITEFGRDVFESANIDSIITFIINKKVEELSVNKFINEQAVNLITIQNGQIYDPYTFDWLFSKHIKFIDKIDNIKSKLSEIGICEGACATSDAYKLKEYIIDINEKEYNPNDFLKIINTGTIDKYTNKWGRSEMTYLGDKYLCPVVKKYVFKEIFTNTYGEKSYKSKLIIKGLTLLDACLDKDGEIIPGKSTLIITSSTEEELKLLLGFLNSKIPLFYIKEKYRGSSYNQGINFNKEMINNLPIPPIGSDTKKIIIKVVNSILAAKMRDSSANISVFEKDINQLFYQIYGLTDEEIQIVEQN